MQTESKNHEISRTLGIAEERERFIRECCDLYYLDQQSEVVAEPKPSPGFTKSFANPDEAAAQTMCARSATESRGLRGSLRSRTDASGEATHDPDGPKPRDIPGNVRASKARQVLWTLFLCVTTTICLVAPVRTSVISGPQAPFEAAAVLPSIPKSSKQPSNDMPAEPAAEQDDTIKPSRADSNAEAISDVPARTTEVTTLFEEFRRQYLTRSDDHELPSTQPRVIAARVNVAKPTASKRARAVSNAPAQRSTSNAAAAGGVGPNPESAGVQAYPAAPTPAYSPTYFFWGGYLGAPFGRQVYYPGPPGPWIPYGRSPYPIPPQNPALQYDSVTGGYIPLARSNAPQISPAGLVAANLARR